jgi:hypothetical protein
LLTKITIWLSLAGYVVGLNALTVAKGRQQWLNISRHALTLGCLLLIAHIALAFHYYHHWSHTAAWLETARQSKAVTNLNWGGGLYVNYLLAVLWLGDVLWSWVAPQHYQMRPRWITATWHGFVLFMIINATIVFGSRPARWLGIAILFEIALLWWTTARMARPADLSARIR